MKKTITIDMERANATFVNAVPEFKMKLEAKPAKQLHPEVQKALAPVAQGFIGLPAIDTMVDKACDAWPGINKLLNTLLRIANWVPGLDKTYIAMAKGWLVMMNADIVPAMCSDDPEE